MACTGCGKEFRDKVANDLSARQIGQTWRFEAAVPRSTTYSLCQYCMYKALQIYECDPKELIDLYERLRTAGFYIPQELIDDEIKEIEIRFSDPHDIMFNPRSS